MRFIFFIVLIFIIVEIGISSYLVYDLHCKNDEEIKNLEKQDVKTIVTLRKVVVLDNFISLLLYSVLISNKDILKFGRGEILTVAILLSIGVMMIYLYMFDNFIEKFKKFNNTEKENSIA
ncbi:Uncharacterised protein [Clostridium perfringens]|uniref:Uncharacterized protein n=1 Tax=Clostridium perfringens TaxID=1502 RepID=A0A2X3BSY3_CLOPF|nr:hypothetical protein [Clostridium perfringens]SQC07202.1 Uncharacterised protein [Clostridium perfringens]